MPIGAPPLGASNFSSQAQIAQPQWSSGSPPYWLGTEYWGSAPTYQAIRVWTSIEIPSSGTVRGDKYAMVLSVFDNQNYYDQIGIASDFGCGSTCNNPSNTWSIAYEQGTYGTYKGITGCGWGGVYSWDGYNSPGLLVNNWYTFVMYIFDGTLYFWAVNGLNNPFGQQIWSFSVPDAATYFLIQNLDPTCHGGSVGTSGAADTTIFEEVYFVTPVMGTGQQLPRWDFTFNLTTVQATSGLFYNLPDSSMYQYGSCLSSCPTIPHTFNSNYAPYYADFTHGPDIVRLANEAVTLYVPGALGTTTYAYPGSFASFSGFTQSVGQAPPDEYCLFYGCNLVFSCTWLPNSGGSYGWSPPFSASNAITYSPYIPSGTATGLYFTSCFVQDTNSSPWETTTVIWYIWVL